MEPLLVVGLYFLCYFFIVYSFYLKRKAKEKREKKERQNSAINTIMAIQDAMGQELAIDGQVPGGIGPFGYSKENPIPVKGTFGPVSYLTRLQTKEGNKVEYERLGSTRTVNIKYPIDIYKISYNNEEICKLYFCGYFNDISNKCPEGLSILE